MEFEIEPMKLTQILSTSKMKTFGFVHINLKTFRGRPRRVRPEHVKNENVFKMRH